MAAIISGIPSGFDPTAKVESRVIPADLSTVTIASTTQLVLVDPAGALTSLTITFPSANLRNGQEINLAFSQTVTTVTMNGGTFIGALTTAVAGTFGTWRWNVATSKWWRID